MTLTIFRPKAERSLSQTGPAERKAPEARPGKVASQLAATEAKQAEEGWVRPTVVRARRPSTMAFAVAQRNGIAQAAEIAARARADAVAVRVDAFHAFATERRGAWSADDARALARAVSDITREAAALPPDAHGRFLASPAEARLAQLRDLPGVREFIWAQNLHTMLAGGVAATHRGQTQEMKQRLDRALDQLSPVLAQAVRDAFPIVAAFGEQPRPK